MVNRAHVKIDFIDKPKEENAWNSIVVNEHDFDRRIDPMSAGQTRITIMFCFSTQIIVLYA